MFIPSLPEGGAAVDATWSSVIDVDVIISLPPLPAVLLLLGTYAKYYCTTLPEEREVVALLDLSVIRSSFNLR
jgi:hypothetical protein